MVRSIRNPAHENRDGIGMEGSASCGNDIGYHRTIHDLTDNVGRDEENDGMTSKPVTYKIVTGRSEGKKKFDSTLTKMKSLMYDDW